jgi:hypothetical protein
MASAIALLISHFRSYGIVPPMLYSGDPENHVTFITPEA